MEKINWEAYKEGYNKCKEVDGVKPKVSYNPYSKDTDNWKSWNKGWNSYYPDYWNKK